MSKPFLQCVISIDPPEIIGDDEARNYRMDMQFSSVFGLADLVGTVHDPRQTIDERGTLSVRVIRDELGLPGKLRDALLAVACLNYQWVEYPIESIVISDFHEWLEETFTFQQAAEIAGALGEGIQQHAAALASRDWPKQPQRKNLR